MATDQKPKAQRKKTGLIVAGAGIAMLCIGYLLLAKGSITAAPILIIGSFGLMFLGIWLGWD